MIVWLNGTFGVGKTTTARALQALARREGRRARIHDPEKLGYILQRAIPRRLRPRDFRDQRAWVAGTRAAVRALDPRDGWLIVPMTVDRPALLAALRGERPGRVFLLDAPREVVAARIHGRPFGHLWGLEHLARWEPIPALGEPVQTDGLTPAAVAAEVYARLTAPP